MGLLCAVAFDDNAAAEGGGTIGREAIAYVAPMMMMMMLLMVLLLLVMVMLLLLDQIFALVLSGSDSRHVQIAMEVRLIVVGCRSDRMTMV